MTIALGLKEKETLLPPTAIKKIQAWIESGHLTCSGDFFSFESVEYLMLESFEECITSLGGTLISVEPIEKVGHGNRRKKILYRAKASLQAFDQDIRQYLLKYGLFNGVFATNG